MCCKTVRREDRQKQDALISCNIGSYIPVRTAERTTIQTFFNGNSRLETLDQKFPASQGWKKGHYMASSYFEGKGLKEKEFQVPEGHGLEVVYKQLRPNLVIANIVTRQAQTMEEKETHDRFPVVSKAQSEY